MPPLPDRSHRCLLLAALACLAAGGALPSRAQAEEPQAKRRPDRSPLPEVLLISSKDPLVRESAAQLLGLRGDPQLVPQLSQALAKDDNKWVRARAAEALGLIGSAAAAAALDSALSREKDQRLRRAIGIALVRLGKNRGVEELMWQLKSGTNNTKAEVMQFLVAFSGQPLGQDVEAWWGYFHGRGRAFVGRRPGGSPALLPLRGSESAGGGPRQGPYLSAARPQPGWQQLPAVVIALPPSRQPVGPGQLQRYVALAKGLPDGCLLLIRSRWQESKPRRRAASRAAKDAGPASATAGQTPGLLPEALEYLLRRAPNLLGLGIDAPSIDPPQAQAAPVRQRLLAAGRLVLEGVGDLELLQPHGTRLVILSPDSNSAPRRRQTQLLAILP